MEIRVSDAPNESVGQAIDAGLERHGKAFVTQPEALMDLQVSCQSDNGTIIGGLLGNTGNTWLHIWQLWVAEGYRSQSLGSQILKAAEHEALRRNCIHAHVETLGFQAVEFYLKHGYEEFGVLDAYVGTHAQHYLRKKLSD